MERLYLQKGGYLRGLCLPSNSRSNLSAASRSQQSTRIGGGLTVGVWCEVYSRYTNLLHRLYCKLRHLVHTIQELLRVAGCHLPSCGWPTRHLFTPLCRSQSLNYYGSELLAPKVWIWSSSWYLHSETAMIMACIKDQAIILWWGSDNQCMLNALVVVCLKTDCLGPLRNSKKARNAASSSKTFLKNSSISEGKSCVLMHNKPLMVGFLSSLLEKLRRLGTGKDLALWI